MDDLDQLVETFKDCRVQIAEGRIDLPHSSPGLASFNTWNANMPGSTMFMPVVEVAKELVNVIMLALEWGQYPIDASDGKPIGCERWVKEGIASTPVPWQAFEPLVAYGACSVETGFITQNLLLTETALGLGGWPFGGFQPQMVLGGTPMCRGLGFRWDTSERGPLAGFPYPIGKDGIFETHHPHYFNGSIDDMVDDIMERKWGEAGLFNPANSEKAPYKKPGQMEQGIPKTSPEIVECTKDIIKEVWKRYGRFPAFTDTCLLTMMVQAHHIECGFYDEYYRDGAYTARHRRRFEQVARKRTSKAA